MEDKLITYFNDPVNRLAALNHLLNRIYDPSFTEFLCMLLKEYIYRNSHKIYGEDGGPKIIIDGAMGDLRYSDLGYEFYKLHELIPELIHPINLPGADYSDLDIPHIDDLNVWGSLLLHYYRQHGDVSKEEKTTFGILRKVRQIHITNAIELVKTKI